MTYVPGHSTSRAASMTRHVGVHPHLGFIEFASVDFFFFLNVFGQYEPRKLPFLMNVFLCCVLEERRINFHIMG